MTWIFGSFLVTPCALTSCYVISKQDSMIKALGYNRGVTGRRPRDENRAVRFRGSAENRSRTRDTQPIRRLGRLWRKIWEEVLFLSICLYNWLIFIKKCFVRSLNFVLFLCMRLYNNSPICRQLNGLKCCYLTLINQFNINHLFVHN